MYKIVPIIAVILSGCSYFTFNATMCEQLASEPNRPLPQECRDYDEKKADKAFNKIVNEKKVTDKDIEFHKEQSE